MSGIRDSVKYQLLQILDDYIVQDEEQTIERILAIPGIAIVDRGVKLSLFTKKDCITIDSWIMERMRRLKITGTSNHQIAKLLGMFMDEQVYPAGYIEEVKE